MSTAGNYNHAVSISETWIFDSNDKNTFIGKIFTGYNISPFNENDLHANFIKVYYAVFYIKPNPNAKNSVKYDMTNLFT